MHAALITGPVLLMAGSVIKRHPLCRWTPFTVAGRTVSLSESQFRASDRQRDASAMVAGGNHFQNSWPAGTFF
jgi:hypothetical protein